MTTATASPPASARVAAVVAVLALLALAALLFLRGGGSDAEVSIYPDHRTLAASPETAITFRGVAPDELEDVQVRGSRSGPHAGELRRHPDGQGAAFVPDEPFAYGERVTVDAGIGVIGVPGKTSSFVVTRRNTVPGRPDDKAKAPVDAGVQTFASQPELHPPAIGVDQSSDAATAGDVFVAPKRGATQQGPMIIDQSGELVWFDPLPGDEQAFDFRAQTYKGRPVLTWWQGTMQFYSGHGVGRIVDTRYQPVATVRAGNGYEMDAHEVKLTPAGTALTMSYHAVPWDLSKLGGRSDAVLDDNVVQEIDVDSGMVLFEWHTLGSIPLSESYRPAPTKRGQAHDPWHLNAIDLDRDGDFILSGRHTSTIYKVDRETGDIVWRLGGKKSDFEMGPGTRFNLQHDARVHADGTLSLFDNVAEDPKSDSKSRALVLRLDQQAKTATRVRQFEHPDGILSTTQGSTELLDGGGAFVGWGGLNQKFTEFDSEGDPVFDARFMAKDVETYRAYRLPWSGLGEGRPRAVASADGGRTTVKVSWNGATRVARWRVRPEGGGEPTTATRTGFETAVTVPGRPSAVVVEALGLAGRVLGRTERVPVS